VWFATPSLHGSFIHYVLPVSRRFQGPAFSCTLNPVAGSEKKQEEQQNPTWEDLAAPCFKETAGPSGRATGTQLRPNALRGRAPQDDDL